MPDPSNKGRIGRRDNGKFTLTPAFSLNGNPLQAAYRQADRRTPAQYRNGYQSPLLEDSWQSAPAIFEEPSDAASLPHHAIYHLQSTCATGHGDTLTLTIASADIGRIRLSVSPFVDPVPSEPLALRPQLASALRSDESDNPELAAAFLLATTPDGDLPPAYKLARDEMLATHAGFAHSMVAQTLPPEKIPPAHVLTRGNWMTPAEEVQPAFPAFLSKHIPAPDKRLTRLDLARWLMSQENPLPSRHFTNRLWQQFFGRGLSGVPDDLGSQGEMPSHPELLDWLASEFRESGWDVKHMVRLIVTSETYRRQAATREELLEKDPSNRLLAGQSARRLDAEFIRDNALAVSGLLDTGIIGGPGIRPYQPEGYYQNLNFPERKYLASTGSDQYRRGLYMHWQRTFVHPMLAAFDAPSREECTAQRYQANSPQQALALLNDPSFVE
nr:DUF1553 domain-containing protein [Akkermansiaceae bacterium]